VRGNDAWTVDEMRRTHDHDWSVGIGAAIVAVAALVGGSEFGSFHGSGSHDKLVAWIAAVILLLSGVVATRYIARALGNMAPLRSAPAAGAAVRLLATGIGYVILVFAVFAVLGVSIQRLLIGAGLIGIVVGIAAQQSLGNIFASLVLLLARPFVVGDRIRIRSGALGGVFEASVLEIGLTYVTVRVDDGEMKIPNSAMLGAGVGRLPSAPGQPITATPDVADRQGEKGES
jgi:small-conductance mechanosensitive channel